MTPDEESAIRADERRLGIDRWEALATIAARRRVRADLRAKVVALRTDFPLGSYEEAIDDVLDLIDGDDQ